MLFIHNYIRLLKSSVVTTSPVQPFDSFVLFLTKHTIRVRRVIKV